MRNGPSHRSLAPPDIDPSVALVQAMRDEGKQRAMLRQRRVIDVPSIGAYLMVAGRSVAGTRNRTYLSFLAVLVVLLGATSVFSQVVACRPFLATKTVRDVRPFSLQPLPWRWSATITADSGFCATRAGNFDVDFVRVKENSPDLQFTQTFRWSEHQFDISMELSPDEAILEFRIGFIAPCVCREAGQLSNNWRRK